MSTNHIEQLLEAIKDGTLTIRHKDGAQWQLDPADKQTICSGLENQIPKKPYALESIERCIDGHDAGPDRYRWHNIRKNPQDLPECNEAYSDAEILATTMDGEVVASNMFTCYESDQVLALKETKVVCEYEYAVLTYARWKYDDGRLEEGWCDEYGGSDLRCVAWRHIEPFEEE